MLKTRNLIFALSLSPLLSFAWQLPNQAQSFSPSKGTAGVDAGAATSASQTSGFSTPTTGGGTTPVVTTTATTTTGTSIIIPIIPGVSATITTGVSTTGNTSVGSTTGDTATGGETAPVAISAATIESTSSSVTVTEGATANTVVITLAPQVQVTVNQLAAAIVQTLSTTGSTTGGTTGGAADVGSLLTGGAGSPQATVALTNSFTAAGISPQLTTALVTSLSGLFNSTSASLPNQPIAQIISGQITASNKTFKPVYIIAQGSAGLNVNISKLNDAIIAYNRIILQSEPNTLRNLSGNTGFVGIGSILKQLRTGIKQPSI
ncbi:MAG: hypothetical protein H9536_14545 [Aphanizomenon flos-aquae Clear-A1]|jgi:hypothetical protein|nr:hypothetical protein [Aphanizomenon flos-aquae Clear-A1]